MSLRRRAASALSNAPRQATPIALPHLLILIGGVALATAPHLPRLPLWVGLLSMAVIAWRAWAAWRGEALPRRWLLVPLTVLIIVGVYVTHRTLLGRDAGVTLLAVLLALKLLEMRALRDVVVTAMLAYFLALAAFFYSQTPSIALRVLCTIVLLTTTLAALAAPHRPGRDHARTAGLLLAQAIPLMVILFFLFPRVQGPLWGMPADAFGGRTGLSDSMSPGNISALSQSDEIAFRVKFDDAPPPREGLYWRGPVFTDFDGRTWRAGDASPSSSMSIETVGQPVRYTVTLEPHDRAWLFALEMPAVLPPEASATETYELHARTPVRTRMRYAVQSYLRYRTVGDASAETLQAALRLPPESNPRATALAHSWRMQTSDPALLVQKAIAHFVRGAYRYSLFPPLAVGPHATDEFLFDSRVGFCEHYAGAFVILMRAAGVPARVVTGYQGGEINPVDGYFTVRQSDAHAWAEVWLGEAGWVRVDPTAAAIPARTREGLAAAVPAGEPARPLLNLDTPLLRTLRFNFEALGNYWNQWVLGYDVTRQQTLMTRLGMPAPDWQNIAMALFWVLGLAVLLLSLWLLRRVTHSDPTQAAWLAFCAKLRRHGVTRHRSEGPTAYTARAALALPERAQDIVDIGRLYAELRYGPQADSQQVAQLARRVHRFRA
jgi:transglutaminase-like putative cysteine protease